MSSYSTDETSFARAFGNRSLLLALLCMLARSGDKPGAGSFMGVPFAVSQGDIVMFGPLFALLVLASMKVEADALRAARSGVLQDAGARPAIQPASRWVGALFFVPTLAAAFLSIQSVTKLVPKDPGCAGFDWTRQFTDFSWQAGSPSVWCFRDVTEGMPWIYPPAQTYASIACVVACAVLSLKIAQSWKAERVASPSHDDGPPAILGGTGSGAGEG